MKTFINKICILLTAIGTCATLQAQTAGYEYWIDGTFEQRTFVPHGTEQIALQVDASALAPGLHRYQFRARDAQNRWSSPLCRYFLRTGTDHSQSRPAMYEYWIDSEAPTHGFQTGPTLNLTLDMERLQPGIHTLKLRTADTEGRWSAPIVHYFLRLGPDISPNMLQRYESWIDSDYDKRQSGAVTDGTLQLSTDISHLSTGIHRFQFRICDAIGQWSSPQALYFARVDTLPTNNAITAYEYWFNKGSARKINVSPANPLQTGDLWIDVDSITPNAVPDDYTIDWSTRTVYCPDNVVFGLRFLDTTGRSTTARCDTFVYNVPQILNPQALAFGEETTVISPDAGRLYSYTVNATKGDSLVWNVSGPCHIDLYDADGKQLYRWKTMAGFIEEKMQAKTDGTLTALVYTIGTDTLHVTCHKPVPTIILHPYNSTTPRITRQGNRLMVEGAQNMTCTICHIQGYVAETRRISSETECFQLKRGIYLVQLTNNDQSCKVVKITIP